MSKAVYFEITTTALAQIFDPREIDVKGGSKAAKLNLGLLSGKPDSVTYIPLECFVNGNDETQERFQTIMRLHGEQKGEVNINARVRVEITSLNSFIKKDDKPGANIEGRLFSLTHITVKTKSDEVLYSTTDEDKARTKAKNAESSDSEAPNQEASADYSQVGSDHDLWPLEDQVQLDPQAEGFNVLKSKVRELGYTWDGKAMSWMAKNDLAVSKLEERREAFKAAA